MLILFNMDESTYARELAPLAGHYPALKLGPPWWFHDNLNGMARYFDQIMETAGVHNTAGFNDDTRAFVSIPARHDVWRRASADWLAGLVLRGLIDQADDILVSRRNLTPGQKPADGLSLGVDESQHLAKIVVEFPRQSFTFREHRQRALLLQQLRGCASFSRPHHAAEEGGRATDRCDP